jgi:hypothetical protein
MMTKLLLSVHVLAAILTVGPIAVAASIFPRYARQAEFDEDPGGGAAGVARLLHRICRAYAVVGIAVPVFGIATGARLGVLTDAWLIVSLALTVVAAGVLALAILPDQQRLLASIAVRTIASPAIAGGDRPGTPTRSSAASGRLAALTGLFNLLWAIVVVLMIVRPGSTTGA